ncbi:MAG: hypothetical protein N2376_01225 [Clostridia bacterium]|nr:hypothetical protein [Clostridia bacterium]
MPELQHFWDKVFKQVNPLFAGATSVISFLIFPTEAFIGWSMAIWIATLLDLLTKCFSIFSKCIRRYKSFTLGIFMAFKTKEFSSETFYRKTVVKVVSYLVIQILVGLSMRLALVGAVNMAVSTIIYNFVFWREAASNIENLIDAGADYLQPLLFWMKKKSSNALENEGTPEPGPESMTAPGTEQGGVSDDNNHD